FYKDNQETGTHVASIWAADGTPLAQATFTNETGSGWQVVQLASPVALHPNVTYVVGANANQAFVQTLGGLAAGVDSGPLHAVQSTPSQPNGVFADAEGTFPTQTSNDSNYFV